MFPIISAQYQFYSKCCQFNIFSLNVGTCRLSLGNLWYILEFENKDADIFACVNQILKTEVVFLD